MASTLNDVNGMNVICVNDTCTTETAHELGENVGWYLFPGEIPEDCEGDCYCRINVGSGDST